MYKIILPVFSIAFYIPLCAQEGFFNYNFTQHRIIDASRLELYPHNNKCPYRAFIIHIWHPTRQHNKQFPLIIFSHGLGGMYNGTSYTWLCENLVRHGYGVVSVSHSYACKPIVLSDELKTEYLFPVPSLHYHNGDLFSREIETWVADMRYVIDTCQQYNADTTSAFYNLFDMSHMVVMGHSFGGSTAMHVCRRDERVRCAINLDGPLYGIDALSPFAKPVLCMVGLLRDMIYSASMSKELVQAIAWSWHVKGQMLPAIMHLCETMRDAYLIRIPDIVHEMFSDCAVVDEKVRALVIDTDTAQAIIAGHVHDFLDCYVRHII